MGKKILVPCLDVIMIAFFLFSIRNMVFHCIFLGKKAIIITRSKVQTKCAHTPWASYNTPSIELIQYGRRTGKKVYWSYLVIYPSEKV